MAALQRDGSLAVDFEKEILPVLKNNCLACHNTTKAKGGLNLETPQLIRKGGDSGPAVSPGQSAESLLFKAAGHLDPELIMPPRDNKANASDLRPEQLALLKLWIEQGAQGEVHANTTVNWLETPPKLDPIFAVALTKDGQFAACGRGNDITVYHVPSRQVLCSLVDPHLSTATGFTHAAHRDLINSLAFDPNGTLLASAAYREVKVWRRPVQVQKTLFTPAEKIDGFALSPDRQWLAAATADHRIGIYQLSESEPRLVHTLIGHSNRITALRFSSNGSRLCSGSLDQTVRLWELGTGKAAALLELPGAVHDLAWLAQDQQIAAAGADGLIHICTVATSNLAHAKELKGHDGPVYALAPLSNGAELLSAGEDGIIRHWNIEDAEVTREIKTGAAVTALALRPDAKLLASAGTNPLAKLWKVEDGKLVAELKGDRYAYEQVAEAERQLAVAKSGVDFSKKSLETAEAENKKQIDRVATATATNTFTEKVFLEKEKAFKESQEAKAKAEKNLNDLLASIKKITEDYEAADQAAKDSATEAKSAAEKAAQAQLASERAALARQDADKTATDTAAVAARTKAAVDNAAAGKETAQRIADESAALAEKSKTFAAAVVADAEVKIKLSADAKSNADKAIEKVAAQAFAAGQLKPAYDKTIAEAPEQRKQATNKIESTTKALDNADKEFKRAETRRSVTGHELELSVQGAARASNQVVKAKATLDTAETHSRQCNEDLEGAKKRADQSELAFRSLTFSPDGTALAALSESGKVHVWNADNGAPIEVFTPPSAVSANATSPTNSPAVSFSIFGSVAFLERNTIVAADGPQRVRAWTLHPAWSLERTIGTGDANSPLSDRVNAVRFSPDGQALATGGGEPTRSGEIKLWNVADGAFLGAFTNVHSDAIFSLDYSPDGKYLASSSADRFVRVLDLATGKIVRAFEGHTSYVLGVAWKADSRTLASAGADNVIKIWDFTTGDRKKNIDGATKEITSISFVGITDQALATSGDNQVRLVKENGEKIRAFDGPADFMNAAAATPDGTLVVAGGQDGQLRVWNGTDGKLMANFGPSTP